MTGGPLRELAALMTPRAPGSGVVVALAGGVAKVATAQGQVSAQAGPGVTVGTRVRLAEGVAQLASPPRGRHAV
ncbi:MAG: hypothetical protein HQL51_03870 [Magnetococcales bacterium]|nr:hypothetical protein [Magnetococcales bacterium]